MRKVFGGVLSVFVIAAVLLVLLMEPKPDTVRLLTIEKPYSRLITSANETLSIPLYVTVKKTFLLDASVIESAYLESNESTLPVTVQAFRDLDSKESYQGEWVYRYMIDLVFPSQNVSTDFIDMEAAVLRLTYQSQASVALSIGDLHLLFRPLEDAMHLDLYRMYGTVANDGYDYLSGIVIGLTNLTSMAIDVIAIDLGFEGIGVDMSMMRYIDDEPAYDTLPDIVLNEPFNPLDTPVTEGVFALDQMKLIYLPIRYPQGIVPLERCPVQITYTYQHQTYTMVIDDFLFFTPDDRLETQRENVRACLYHY